jgi:serine/threonine protein kinase
MNERRETRIQSLAAAPDPEDPRVVAAVEEYLAELEAGADPERQAFLARFPEIAPTLADCLDGLRLVHELTPRLLPTVEPAPAAEEGRREPLGDFRILREVGRGGMGIVYEAVQLSLGRRVALKVLPLAAALDGRQLQRFRNEAQAAAQLHHTNIVPVYAVGCDRGVHYYAMQFIEGQSLAAVIADARAVSQTGRQADRETGRPGDRDATNPQAASSSPCHLATLSPCQSVFERHREVARLGLKAAEALEHAHQLAVVHRDIKPANLLLDARGNLWVTDFGLALFQSDAGLTMTGEVLGTLRYMSPEQAVGKRGVVDHRTDVYSLGMTLYELATLRPAFDGQDRHELLHQILTEDPPPPRRLDPSLPVELETILLKATAKSPAERYATAQDLAEDLQRFLEHRPILARRPTLLERVTKWGRRHRPLVVSGVLLLVMAVAALLTTTLLIAREQAATRDAYERERQSALEARAQRALAEENFRQARQAVDSFARLVEELDDHSPVQGLRRQMLEAALGYYQDFLEQHQDVAVQAELEASRARVARLLDELSALQGSGQLTALHERAVQADLKLSAEQRRRVAALSGPIKDGWREAFRAFRTLGEEQRRAKTLELARAEEKAVGEVLRPEQAARFRQILLQLRQRGPLGFSDPELVHTLKLTARQRDKIRRIQQDAYLAPWGGWHAGGKMGRGHVVVSGKAVYEKALTVLTAEQRAQWQEMAGAPLEGEVRFMPAGPHFGPPGSRLGLGPPAGFAPRRPR